MQTRPLGRTGLEVSVLGYGGMELRLLDERAACKLLNSALDGGLNYIDTSPEYPSSEYFIGRAIAHRRDEFTLATKCGDNMTGIGPTYQFDRKTILDNVDESLRLMKTDHVDVLQLHGVTPEMLPGGEGGEAMSALREIKAAGKALHIGVTVCNRGPGQYGYPAGYGYNSLLRFAAWRDIEVVQLVYGGLTRLSENAIAHAHDRYRTGIIARGAVKLYDAAYNERLEVSRVAELCEEGESVYDFLLRFALSHPGVAAAVVGTKNIRHLRDDIRAAERGPLPADVYAQAKLRLNFAGAVPGPAELWTGPSDGR